MTITGAPDGFLAGLRILTIMNAYRGSSKLFSNDDVVRSSDSVFWFIEGHEDSLNNSTSDGARGDIIDVFDEEVEGENSAIELQSKKNFWENQHNLLQTTLYRTTALETGIRNATREALKKIDVLHENYCKCGKALVGNDCRFCLTREVANRLCEAGYNCGVCRSKWTSSSDVPSGKHTYLDIIDSSSTKKGEVRVIIELNFRSEFEIAKASQDYNKLISQLPEVFVGKVERLRSLVKILCSAAKKCMKGKKMHMGPWRRYKYMQAKWFTLSERLETHA